MYDQSVRVLVCGGRDFNDASMVREILDQVHEDLNISCIIEGGARGADRLAGAWALVSGIDREVYHADWNRYGRRAGYLRNVRMANEGKPDLIVAFPGGKGTAMMESIAKDRSIPVYKAKEWMVRRVSVHGYGSLKCCLATAMEMTGER